MQATMIEISCDMCRHEFKGFVNENLEENKTYSAKCSKCKNNVFFNGNQEVLSHEKTPDAVKIMFVEVL